MALQVLILGSLGTYRVLSTDFNGVVFIISGYEVLSNSNEYFYMLIVLKVLILVSLICLCINLIYFSEF